VGKYPCFVTQHRLEREFFLKHLLTIDELVDIDCKDVNTTVKALLPIQRVIEDAEFIKPDLATAASILRDYTLSVRTFLKVRNPLIVICTTDFKVDVSLNFYSVDFIVAVMRELKTHYEHVGLIWAVGATSDYVKYSAVYQTMLRAELSEYVLLFNNMQPVWPLFRHAHVLLWPAPYNSTTLQEALHCKIPVIASSVCDRSEGIVVYQKDNAKECVATMLPFLPKRGRRKIPFIPFKQTERHI